MMCSFLEGLKASPDALLDANIELEETCILIKIT